MNSALAVPDQLPISKLFALPHDPAPFKNGWNVVPEGVDEYAVQHNRLEQNLLDVQRRHDIDKQNANSDSAKLWIFSSLGAAIVGHSILTCMPDGYGGYSLPAFITSTVLSGYCAVRGPMPLERKSRWHSKNVLLGLNLVGGAAETAVRQPRPRRGPNAVWDAKTSLSAPAV